MAKEVKAIIKDKNTIVLDEDASKGDYISLDSLKNVDVSGIERAIEDARDKLYQEKLEQAKKDIERDVKVEYLKEKHALDSRIKELEDELKDAENVYSLKLKTELSNQELELVKKHQIDVDKLKEDLRQAQDDYKSLYYSRANTQTKNVGEDLEVWCNEQMLGYMQNGFSNCKWYKANIAIKEDDDQKGTKPDYIFEIYTDSTFSDMLTNVCLEMKNESPDSKTHKKESDYFAKLDKDRCKNGCKYALLVSTLENSYSKDMPMCKVLEYEDMYVVKASYMINFLSMLVSLTNRFAHLTIEMKNKDEKALNIQKLKDVIQEEKAKLLDKPLEKLQNKLGEIRKNSEAVSKASENIDKLCDEISRDTINLIEKSFEKFDKAVEKANKEFNK